MKDPECASAEFIARLTNVVTAPWARYPDGKMVVALSHRKRKMLVQLG